MLYELLLKLGLDLCVPIETMHANKSSIAPIRRVHIHYGMTCGAAACKKIEYNIIAVCGRPKIKHSFD